MFGCPLAELCEREKSSVPRFVQQSIRAVEARVCNRTGRAFPSLKASFQNPRRRPPGRGWGAGSRGKERELPSRNQSKGFSARPLNPGSAPPSAPGLDIDGLYRISGNLATIQKLRYKVDHGEARPLALPQACRRLKERADLFFLPPYPLDPPPQMNVWIWKTGTGRTFMLSPAP